MDHLRRQVALCILLVVGCAGCAEVRPEPQVLGAPSGTPAEPSFLVANPPASFSADQQEGAQLGWSLAGGGDVNADGFDDVMAGAPSYDAGAADTGAIFLFLGTPVGMNPRPLRTVAPEAQAGALFGWSVAHAGDVNGDGFSDVVVGAPSFDDGAPDTGRAYLYLGTPDGLAASPTWSMTPDPQAGARFGFAVAAAADVNGDGLADVVIGAPLYDGGAVDSGRAWLFLGTRDGLANAPAWAVTPEPQAGARFGAAIAAAGDVNGDGTPDVIVGAPDFDDGAPDTGRAYVFAGGATGTGLGTAPAWRVTAEPQAGGGFGGAVASAGDVNGDGLADVVVGASGYDDRAVDAGRAWLFLGGRAGLAAAPSWSATMPDPQAGARFGVAVASVGDIDNDGLSDVLVGAHLYDKGAADSGAAALFLGTRDGTGLRLDPAWADVVQPQVGARFGQALAGAGDLNGDGKPDAVVAAPLLDNAPNTGGVWSILLAQYPVNCPSTGCWRPVTTVDAPSARFDHTAVWATDCLTTKGNQGCMIVWGGQDSTTFFKSGGKYRPRTDSWKSTKTTGAPLRRVGHTAVWAPDCSYQRGEQGCMIVWGGSSQSGSFLDNGGMYDPRENQWKPMADPPSNIAARANHTAVWATDCLPDKGEQGCMIVWGGEGSSGVLDNGCAFLPPPNSNGIDEGLWLCLPTAPIAARSLHTAVWAKDCGPADRGCMVIFGGTPTPNAATPTAFFGGAKYDPVANTWSQHAIVLVQFLLQYARHSHTAAAGPGPNTMTVWGGIGSTGGCLARALRYRADLDKWEAVSPAPYPQECEPTPRSGHAMAALGNHVVTWGGCCGSCPVQALVQGYVQGGDLDTTGWELTTHTPNPPGFRVDHTAVAVRGTDETGGGCSDLSDLPIFCFIFWGGRNAFPGGVAMNTGGRYNPQATPQACF